MVNRPINFSNLIFHIVQLLMIRRMHLEFIPEIFVRVLPNEHRFPPHPENPIFMILSNSEESLYLLDYSNTKNVLLSSTPDSRHRDSELSQNDRRKALHHIPGELFQYPANRPDVFYAE